MKEKTLLATTITALVLAILAATPLAIPVGTQLSTPVTGNGAPSGPHFNLNLIGAKTTNCPQTEGSGGNVIFVPLFGNSKIELFKGDTFAVLDNNACTDKVAQFQLPPTNTTGGVFSYTVWARVVGKPGGSGSLTTCATNSTSLETLCSLNQVITVRTKGQQKFVNVTTELTTLCFINSLGQTQCVNIFDPAFQDFFWSYDNQGQKILQLRFYPVA
jgi:hypothetical protein